MKILYFWSRRSYLNSEDDNLIYPPISLCVRVNDNFKSTRISCTNWWKFVVSSILIDNCLKFKLLFLWHRVRTLESNKDDDEVGDNGGEIWDTFKAFIRMRWFHLLVKVKGCFGVIWIDLYMYILNLVDAHIILLDALNQPFFFSK